MATLSLEVTRISQTSAIIHWEIDDMDDIIQRAGLCADYPDGSTNAPGAIFTSTAASGGAASGNYTAYKTKYPSGYFKCYGFGRSSGGYYYSAGGLQDIGWDWPDPTPTRPANWSWRSTVAAGKPINLSAAEWNAFCDRIDAFRIYAGHGAWGLYKPVSSGTEISAAIVNEARAAIGPITTAARPRYINPGDPITADYFNSLKDFLNSVP